MAGWHITAGKNLPFQVELHLMRKLLTRVDFAVLAALVSVQSIAVGEHLEFLSHPSQLVQFELAQVPPLEISYASVMPSRHFRPLC